MLSRRKAAEKEREGNQESKPEETKQTPSKTKTEKKTTIKKETKKEEPKKTKKKEPKDKKPSKIIDEVPKVTKQKKVIIENADVEIIPEKLKFYVSEEIWSGWSPIRRESFKQIIKNPNSFFYRNRPPGDPQKYGAFTQEEEELFLQRLSYFRKDLGIDDGLWGLFSVPIKGRLGYQCSNFYRQLIKDGRIKDCNYQIQSDGKLKFKHGQAARSIDPSILELLEKEAFDFINQCLIGDGSGATPQVSAPIRVDSDRPVAFKKYKGGSGHGYKPSKEFTDLFGRKRNLPEKKFDVISGDYDTGGKGRRKKDRRSWFEEEQIMKCPIYGAPDPMSGDPMTNPMMDENGFVMDLRSWRRVFRYGDAPPCELVAVDEGDLIELTLGNFSDYRLHIVNIPC